MYIIGITPGAYTLGRIAGTEIARELSGIAEKIAFGYTVGCNFFQIDEEAFGEFLDPLLIDKLVALIEKMNVEWALHGMVLTGFYQALDSLTIPEWKTANLILHRDLTFLYELLLKLKKRNASPKSFPHYIVYHSSREYIVGYGIVRERGRLEANTVNPFGERSWINILENPKRRELLEFFKEKILPILYERIGIIRIRERSFFPIFFSLFFFSYVLKEEKIDKERLKKIIEIIVSFLEETKKYEEKIKEKIDEIAEEVKNEIEKIPIREELSKLFFDILERKIKEKLNLKEDLNLYKSFDIKIKKDWEEFLEKIKKDKDMKNSLDNSLDRIYEEWKNLTTQREIRGIIPYEDVIICLISKDVELNNKSKDYVGILNEKKDWNSKETYKFLYEVFIKKIKVAKENKIEEKEVESIEEHVKELLNQKIFDYETSSISLTPQLNALTSIFYWICNFLVEAPIEHRDEVIKRSSFYDEDMKKKLIEYSLKNGFEKLKILIEELKNFGVKRKTKFFIGVETPEGESPLEGLRRICHLKDVFSLAEALNISFRNYCNFNENAFEVVIDTEHLLSHAFDPKAEIEETIEFYKKIKPYSRIAVYHIGIPKPYGGTTHIPFDIGSDAQLLIYEYCYLLKNLGFREEFESYLIFERGGGVLPYEFLKTVILGMRKIVEYLEKNVDPKEIKKNPEKYIDFFGLSYDMFNRWYEIMKEHAFDPLKGLIVFPEETHTYLGREAIEKYRKRPEEWKAEELK